MYWNPVSSIYQLIQIASQLELMEQKHLKFVSFHVEKSCPTSIEDCFNN